MSGLNALKKLETVIPLNNFTTISETYSPECMPSAQQFKLLKQILGAKTPDIFYKYRVSQEIDEQLVRNAFSRMAMTDIEGLTYVIMLGMSEVHLEANAFTSGDPESPHVSTFEYLSENGVQDFNRLVELGVTATDLSWISLRHQEQRLIKSDLNYWLFSYCVKALLECLVQH